MQLCFLNSIIKEAGWLTKYDQLNIIFLYTILWHRALLRNEINLSKNCPDLQAILNDSKVFFSLPFTCTFIFVFLLPVVLWNGATNGGPPTFVHLLQDGGCVIPSDLYKTQRSTEQPVTIATSWDFPLFGIKTCSVGKKQRRTWS